VKGAFRSLSGFNYRVWVAGALVSNVGTWMQRIAQDWLVLTQLTHHNATAVGVIMSLQFGPQLLFLPVTGFVADHFDRRKLLFATQAAMGVLALGLGVLTIEGWVGSRTPSVRAGHLASLPLRGLRQFSSAFGTSSGTVICAYVLGLGTSVSLLMPILSPWRRNPGGMSSGRKLSDQRYFI